MRISIRHRLDGSKESLVVALVEIMNLDERYPMLITPRTVRALNSDGYFDIERRPWDFLMLLGYVKHLLYIESGRVPEASSEIYWRCRQIERFYRRPKYWVREAFRTAEDFIKRFQRISGKSIPQLSYVPVGYKGCNSMLYVLQTFTFDADPIAVKYGIKDAPVILKEMRDYIAAMEYPPANLIEAADKILANYEHEEAYSVS